MKITKTIAVGSNIELVSETILQNSMFYWNILIVSKVSKVFADKILNHEHRTLKFHLSKPKYIVELKVN